MNRIIMRWISALLTGVFLATQTGCSTVASRTQQITVMTTEPDAKIVVNGQVVGTGQATVKVPCDRNVAILATKDGYYPAAKDIRPEFSRVGILDIVGGSICLLPFLGLLFPGSHVIPESNVVLPMQKLRPSDK